MWPVIIAVGGLATLLFGTKPKGKTGAVVLAESTTKYGQPTGTQNWPSLISGRVYRVTKWTTPEGTVALIVGGSAAAQPTTPDAYWLIQRTTGDNVKTLSSVEPDSTAKTDFATLQKSFVS
jgi:hypothetical protein